MFKNLGIGALIQLFKCSTQKLHDGSIKIDFYQKNNLKGDEIILIEYSIFC